MYNYILIDNYIDTVMDRMARHGYPYAYARGYLAGQLICMGLMDCREDAIEYVCLNT